MRLRIAALLLCGGVAALTTACATKGYVREQMGSTETRIGQRVDTQETMLRQTSERTTAAIDTTNQRIQGLDARATEIGGVATNAQREAAEAKKNAAAVADKLGETETRFSQRLAVRNVYSMLETKSIYFDFGKAGLRDEGVNELSEIARALKADPNAPLRADADRGTPPDVNGGGPSGRALPLSMLSVGGLIRCGWDSLTFAPLPDASPDCQYRSGLTARPQTACRKRNLGRAVG